MGLDDMTGEETSKIVEMLVGGEVTGVLILNPDKAAEVAIETARALSKGREKSLCFQDSATPPAAMAAAYATTPARMLLRSRRRYSQQRAATPRNLKNFTTAAGSARVVKASVLRTYQ